MIDSDKLFKELLKTFFVEFLDLFFPEMRSYMDAASIEFLDKQYYTDQVTGERREADIIAKVKFREQEAFFITAIENQGDLRKQANFEQRFFFYFTHFHQQFRLPVYPIAVLYGKAPKRPYPNTYVVEFPDWRALEFRFRPVQLNRLNWREFINNPNPVAVALMSRMNIKPADRPYVKLLCLRKLLGLKLNPAKSYLLSGFVDLSLNLNEKEEETFQQEIAKLEPRRRKKAMEMMTSWERKGFKEGLAVGEKRGEQRGEQRGEKRGIELGEKLGILKVVTLLLEKQVGVISLRSQKRLEKLSTARLEALSRDLFGFSKVSDLTNWLNKNSTS